ncbi:putative quinol monooxygenase [Methanobacterium aggregans]|uniref:putative quinol monooxygenase n=1 Tax=Methanobacterium aggregans TaxID=1615586 RepID=UPI001AE6DA96|nr:antibiotic biosynthesis monooxygenase [Methanobacterium aggregans]MBP2045116.1 heme-degrading monooxygenase HmoA [Methanobacterium aggregans]
MVHIIAQLKLESFDKWKPVFDERSAIRKEAGSKEASLFRNSNDPNEAMILFEWDNMENAKKYLESEALREALKKMGVTFTITYLDEVETTV